MKIGMSNSFIVMKVYINIFKRIISPENLFGAWNNFRKGKANKSDVVEFEWNLEQNIFRLHRELSNKTYQHQPYSDFYIVDPKQRHIHKATVRDRVLHHAVMRVLNPIFEPTFIAHSFSCRIDKGTHKGVEAVRNMARRVSRNYTQPCFILKCDVKKFFDTVDHSILLSILGERIQDEETMWLLRKIIDSFCLAENRGLPIGNLTSQLFANIYLNKFDQFIKHELKVKYYARYTDDFIVVAGNREYLEQLIEPIRSFLRDNLLLELHPKKISIRKLSQGIDFLGYIIFPHYCLVRRKTERRMPMGLTDKVREYNEGIISKETVVQSLNSYLGVLSHACGHRVSEELINQVWFWVDE